MTSDKSQNKLEFRRTQAADPATNTRRCGKSKQMKKGYVIYVTDIGRKCGRKCGDVHHVTESALTDKRGERPQVSPRFPESARPLNGPRFSQIGF